MIIKSLKGVNDILPEQIHKWLHLENSARELFETFGFKEIRIPIIEESSLFVRSIGQGTDIVEKEMYTFNDKGERNIALRPEATASVVRAYLEHNLSQQGLIKLFYMGPMFRGEKPQSGRNRQFYQIGVEALGSDNPFLDAEIISLAACYMQSLYLKNLNVEINSVGCKSDKTVFSAMLKQFLKEKKQDLCESCQKRLEHNVLRVFDCKDKNCRKIIDSAPKISEHLCANCSSHFALVKDSLEMLGVKYVFNKFLVRGLDYYTKTVFEITHPDLGSQNAIAAGGRYNNLIEDLGGTSNAAIGFALGMERTILALEAEKIEINPPLKTKVYVIGLGETAYKESFVIANELRKEKITVYTDYEQKSLKSQLRQADKLLCRYVIIIGDEELKHHHLILRDMQSGQQETIALKDFLPFFKTKVKTTNEEQH